MLYAAAQQKKKPRVVYASSSSVYGDRPELPKREDAKPKQIKISGEIGGRREKPIDVQGV